MLAVHAPHESIHTWRDFFIHIATIVIGLCIAVGIEQTVEYFHHRSQRELLEQQMSAVLNFNRSTDSESVDSLNRHRMYLAELRSAIDSRLHGRSEPQSPSVRNARMATKTRQPSLAPYEAAKQSGLVALLPTERIRIYSRLAFQLGFLNIAVRDWSADLHLLSAFQERFSDSDGHLALGRVGLAPELGDLTRIQLDEYLAIVSSLIKRTDLLVERYRLFDLDCATVLEGVTSEDELTKKVAAFVAAESERSATVPVAR